MILHGEHIFLRPMTIRERYLFFRWATRSDAAPFWYGDLYGDEPPSYFAFKADWQDYYFDGSRPEKGRCFAIMLAGKPIGQINYNEIENSDRSTELDILIASALHQGLGYGTEAIRLLTEYLFREMGVRRCRIEVVSRNPRAVRAYEKAGYRHSYSYIREGITWLVMEELAPEYLPDSRVAT
ncbi:MAG: GNAT family N-acetyltransferase [Bacteroidia bacterium]|nr:GNAT family N-acetyltransferase [Bacteroidia bacterium]